MLRKGNDLAFLINCFPKIKTKSYFNNNKT